MVPMVFSPYELHARSLCASSALLLGDPAVTLLPAPLEGTSAGDVGRAMLDSPGFERLMERWRWSSALWRGGALCGGVEGESPLEHVRRAASAIVEGEVGGGAGSLGALVRETRFEETAHYLEAISRDLERGGGDPSVSVPVTAGLESYASAVGGVMVVSDGRSLVGRLEARRERVVGRMVATVVHGCGGVLLGELREALEEELVSFRTGLWEVMGSVGGASLEGAVSRLGEACERLGAGIAALPAGALGPRDEEEERVRGGVRPVGVSLTVAVVPKGDALAAASRAAELLAAGAGVRGGRVRHSFDRVASGLGAGENGPAGASLAVGSVVRLRVRELGFTA